MIVEIYRTILLATVSIYMGFERLGELVYQLYYSSRADEAKASVSVELRAAANSLDAGKLEAADVATDEIDKLKKLLERFNGDHTKMTEFFADIAVQFETQFGRKLTLEDFDEILEKIFDRQYSKERKVTNAKARRQAIIQAIITDATKVTDDSEVEMRDVLDIRELKYLQAYLRVGPAEGEPKLSRAVASLFASEISEGANPQSVYAQSMNREYRTRLFRELENIISKLQTTFKATDFSFKEEQLKLAKLSPNQLILVKQMLKVYNGQNFKMLSEVLEPKKGNGDLKKKKK